jgi:formamidopyrimidine-DNA glycosylase
MPELPEVETVRRTLAGPLVGRRIETVRFAAFPGVVGECGPETFAARVGGRTVTDCRRRAKYLLLDLDDGTTLMVHLRMTGQLGIVEAGHPPLRFEHLALLLDDGRELRFADQRKFGRVLHLDRDAARALERRFAPEPLGRSFTAAWLAEALARRSGKLKSVVLDQDVVAGLGNIYADEALFRARLHPERPANGLSTGEVRRLHRALRAVLAEGVAHRGTTFSSFQDAAGREGENQFNLRVYGKGGRGLCPRCGVSLERSVVGGRGTSFCPRCQRMPGDRRRLRRGTGTPELAGSVEA